MTSLPLTRDSDIELEQKPCACKMKVVKLTHFCNCSPVLAAGPKNEILNCRLEKVTFCFTKKISRLSFMCSYVYLQQLRQWHQFTYNNLRLILLFKVILRYLTAMIGFVMLIYHFLYASCSNFCKLKCLT